MRSEFSLPDVVVVGAGPSGLAAANRLRQAGAKVLVLERSDRVGGKMRTTPREGFVVDQGAFFLPTNHRRLLSLAIENGQADSIVPGGFVLGTFRDNTIHNIDGNNLLRTAPATRLLSLRAKVEAVKVIPELLRARSASFDRIEGCGRLDNETLADWAKNRFSKELQEYLFDTTLRGIFATRADTAPRVDFLAILSLLKGASLVAFKEGMGSYAENLATGLTVSLDSEVLSIEEEADGVVVVWRGAEGDRQLKVPACVVAVPAKFARQIYPGMDSWRRGFLERVRHGRTFVLNIGLTCPPKGISATYLLVPKSSHPFITGIMLDHHKAPGRVPEGKGLLSVAVLDSWCEANWDKSDDSIQHALLAAVDTLIPDTANNAEFIELHRWFQEYNTVGFYRNLAEFRRICRSDQRLQLAGDYHAMQNLESATLAGLQAADRLIDNRHLYW